MHCASRLVSLLAIFLAVASAGSAEKQKSAGLKRSGGLPYEEDAAANAPAPIPPGYALVVGIADYKNLPAKAQLQFSGRDADALYSVLISPEGGNFRAENVHRLTGAKATLANLRQELEVWLPSVAKEDDRVVIYFAGDGFFQDGRAYLAPYDLDPARISSTGYPVDELASVVESKIAARNKIVIADSCHSGAIGPDADAEAYNKRLLNLSTSVFSLIASRDRERSLEGAEWGGGHGVFTYYAVKGLEGAADQNGDGIVTADELADYAYRNVREATKDRQNPVDSGGLDAEMPAGYIPADLRAVNPTTAGGPNPSPDCSAPELSSLCTLLSKGAADEVIRQLDAHVQHKKPPAAALPLLAQAYRMKADYAHAIDTARAAIKLEPKAAEAHLWLADSLRLTMKYQEATAEYIGYLRLSNLDHEPGNGTADHLRAYLTQAGSKKIDASTDEWRSVRSMAFSGLCDAERSLMQYTTAIGYCRKSLAYDPTDPYTQYALALCYMHEAQANGSLELLAAAQAHFRKTIELAPDAEEAKTAKANLRNIDIALAAKR